MQITALIQVINYLKDKSGDPVLLEGYQRLSNLIKEASKKPETDFSDELMKEKDLLQKLLWESDPVEWGYASYSLFEKINISQLFGKAAADWLAKHIKISDKDYKKLDAELTKKIKQINQLSENLGQFMRLFDQIFPEELFRDDEEDNKTNLILYFEGKLKVNNITDLERYARLWDNILGTFSGLTNEENLTLDISSIRNGSIVLGVSTHEKTLSAIMEGVKDMLSSLPVLLKIRKIQTELTQIPLNNNLIDLLEDEAQGIINQSAHSVALKLTFKYPGYSFDDDIMVKSLSRSLKQIQSFIDKGGKIEFKPLVITDENSQINKMLNESFDIVREMGSLSESLEQTLAEKEIREVVASE